MLRGMMGFVGSLECLLGHCGAKREAVAVACDMPPIKMVKRRGEAREVDKRREKKI